MFPTQKRMVAFSLIELLVVIAIIAILLGLLLTAIQQTRATAQRGECANKLHQIGIALHTYHDNNNTLPPGMSLTLDQGRYPFLSWNARLLPYLEQDALLNDIRGAYAINSDFKDVPPHVHRKTVVSAYLCPSDPISYQSQKLVNGLEIAFTNYLGVEGTDQYRHDGLLYLDSRVRFGDVNDGLSYTLMVGERPPSNDFRFGWWYAANGQHDNGSADMVLGVREQNDSDKPCPSGPYHFVSGDSNTDCDFLHFWSHHPGGAHFLFADGSVRFLSYASDPILPALATRSGGETVDLP